MNRQGKRMVRSAVKRHSRAVTRFQRRLKRAIMTRIMAAVRRADVVTRETIETAAREAIWALMAADPMAAKVARKLTDEHGIMRLPELRLPRSVKVAGEIHNLDMVVSVQQ